MKWHKKIWSWTKRNYKVIIGVTLHSLWLGASFGLEEMTQVQHIAGHGIIGASTGVSVGIGTEKGKKIVNNVIKKAKGSVPKQNPKGD